MSKKSLLGIDLNEWKALSGLSDPYSLELAKISAEAGVPSVNCLSEARLDVKPEKQTPTQKRLGLIKNRHRKLRNSGKGSEISGSFRALDQLKKQTTEDGEQMVFPYDAYLEAFLEDQGSSLYDFNMLLDYAVENDDFDLQAELLAVEEMLDEALGGVLAGAAKAAGAIGRGASRAAGWAGRNIAKGASSLAKAGKEGFQAGMKGAGNAAKAAAPGASPDAAPDTAPKAPEPSGDAPAPNAPAATGAAPAAAPPPAPAAGAAPGGGTPAAPQAQTGGGSPQQPGQTTPAAPVAGAKKKKGPGGLALLGRGIGKVAKGLASVPGGAVRSAAKAAGSVVGGAKKGYAGEDIEHWESFLDENGLSVDEYMLVVEHAFDIGDDEMIESLHQLDEAFKDKLRNAASAVTGGAVKSSDTVAQDKKDKEAKTQSLWKMAQAGKMVRGSQDRTQRGRALTPAQLAQQKKLAAESVNDVMDKQLQLMGYTDEYIEARSKSQQYHGARMQGAFSSSDSDDDKETFGRYYKRDTAKLAKKSSEQDKGNHPSLGGRKKMRSLPAEHDAAFGDTVRRHRKDRRDNSGEDKLAAKAARSPRERRSEIRRKARGHR